MSRFFRLVFVAAAVVFMGSPIGAADEKLKFARYAGADGKPVYGVVEGDNLREISGAPFGEWKRTDRTTPIDRAKFLSVTDRGTAASSPGRSPSGRRSQGEA